MKGEEHSAMDLTIHAERCSGCRLCEVLCSLRNDGVNAPAKARLRVVGQFPEPGHYSINICNLCGDCAEACPTGAITLIDGHYAVDDDLCTQCDICIDVCTSHAITKVPATGFPQMCNRCGECFDYCPLGVFERHA